MKNSIGELLGFLETIGGDVSPKTTKESTATSAFLSKARTVEGWWYKIADEGISAKPFDIIGSRRSMSVGIEFKVIKKKNESDPEVDIKKKLEVHQIASLIDLGRSGGGLSVIGGYYPKTGKWYFYEYKV